MSHAFPARVLLQEEGPREGFQSEAPLSLAAKLELIDALASTGLHDINCVSFVDARRVPQMADADEVAAGITRRPGVRYSGIWFNTKGFQRALASGLDLVPNVVCSVSDTFARRNNGCSADELIGKQGEMIEQYRAAGRPLEVAHVFTAFGCHYEGRLEPAQTIARTAALLDECAQHGASPRVLYLCDTVGMANPHSVRTTLALVRERWPDLELALHLHDTRGMGLANVLAGLEMGVARFDASIGGLGGCPFAGSSAASGNVCTEDVALMCEEMGIATGLDIGRLVECARLAETIVGHPLPGRVMKLAR